MAIILNIIAFIVILGAVIPLIRTSAWWVRIFDFPRGQLAAVGGVLLVVMWFTMQSPTITEYALLVALLLSIGFLVYRIYPYTPIAPAQVQSAASSSRNSSIRLLCANVLQSNRDASKLMELIRIKDPDLILVVETDTRWEKALKALEANYPVQLKQPQDNTYGMLLYSRLPIRKHEIKFLLEDDVPSMFTTIEPASGRRIQVIGIHPRPPRPDKMQDSTARDGELLIVAKYARHQDDPVIVLGDFNDVAWSHTTRLFQRVSGLLDPRKGRGLYNTFHADYPFFRYPLDHIFHSRHFRVAALERLSHIGSDHFPIFAELSLEHDAVLDQEEPEPEGDDDQEAKAIIRAAV